MAIGWLSNIEYKYESYMFHIEANQEANMGIVKITEELHEDIRKASSVMCRSINAQAEFWVKVGMLAGANLTLSFNEIIKMELEAADLNIPTSTAA